MAKLTEPKYSEAPFELCFKYELESGYTFKEFTKENNRELQRFLDKIVGKTITEVDHSYKRKTDKLDKYNGMQVLHYGTGKFRIHVVLEAGTFKVIRLDPNHKKHKC